MSRCFISETVFSITAVVALAICFSSTGHLLLWLCTYLWKFLKVCQKFVMQNRMEWPPIRAVDWNKKMRNQIEFRHKKCRKTEISRNKNTLSLSGVSWTTVIVTYKVCDQVEPSSSYKPNPPLNVWVILLTDTQISVEYHITFWQR